MEYTPSPEHALDIQRQMLLFHKVIKHLEKRGFTSTEEGVADLCYEYYVPKKESVSIELSESEGYVSIHYHENIHNEYREAGGYWKDLTSVFDADLCIQQIDNCLRITTLKAKLRTSIS